MMTVHEVIELTGVSIRTLQRILLFRELEFPLKEIRTIIRSPEFNRQKALNQQINCFR